MSENNGVNNNDFRFEIRYINRNKDDYKDSKKEKFLFEYLANDSNFFAKLDMEDGTQGVITSNDINIFLSSKEVQKKQITEEDVINFLNKVKSLNPTEQESAYSQMSFVDENNQSVMNDEIYQYFGLETRSKQNLADNIIDSMGNIKQGFEIFDLNNDGKLDNYETYFYEKNSTGSKGYTQLNTFLTALDNSGGTDGIINTEDKQVLYNQIVDARNAELMDELRNNPIKDTFGRSVISSEIVAVFENGNTVIRFEDILDKNGWIKRGFEIFDLNGDRKIDDFEKSFFASGGHPISDDVSQLSLEKFLQAIDALDFFGYSYNSDNNESNNVISSFDKRGLYSTLKSSSIVLDNISTLPEDLQNRYKDALKNVYFGDDRNKTRAGVYRENYVSVNNSEGTDEELSLVVMHELTHHLLKQNNMRRAILQEVETFYMEYKLFTEAKANNKDFLKLKLSDIRKDGTAIVDEDYFNYISELKTQNPDISEKELAVEAFINFYLDSYKKQYNDTITPDELRRMVMESSNFVYLK